MTTEILNHLVFLYGEKVGRTTYEKLKRLMAHAQDKLPQGETAVFSERDSILITYGDQVQEPGKPPLQSLAEFCEEWVNGRISTIHILPFYPYSSDDGFSVIDYKAVNPDFGSWQDVSRLGENFGLMFDAVINHISAQSNWFQQFLAGNPTYQNYFTVVEPNTDLSTVFRPRALPLLTSVETTSGTKHVWTTFSPDQIDLNYDNPDVLLAITDTLLFYVTHGARYIRLDAIGFMWKEIGTSCLHLPKAHRAIQLMRCVLNQVAPHVALITETNVPHEDNISYFGDGTNEAQMVYNFSLPPLTLHTFHTGNAAALTKWAASLALPSDQVTFFNFLASHDGIGVMPARGILPEEAIDKMAKRVEALGGFVSYKNNSDGSQSAYELNINYLEALGDPNKNEPLELIAKRFLASQAIMLAVQGVPGIYFHSLFGSRNWHEGVKQTGRNRTINREKLNREMLQTELTDTNALRHHVLNGYVKLLQHRRNESAFHPTSKQAVIDVHPAVFALWRGDENQLLCLHNVSNDVQQVTIPLSEQITQLRDLIGGEVFLVENGRFLTLTLTPYQVLWLSTNS
ncbi:MAG: sugar phosphorylase [Chloroflexi bacterium]|nr:MAG: sugar phosphorylase [Chloroflexota bacterium]